MNVRSSISKRLGITLAIGATITLLEFIGGIISNSVSLFSDAGHMLSDVIAILMSLIALRLSLKAHTVKFTYGYHRAEILIALVNGILLIIVSSLLILESYDRFVNVYKIDLFTLISIASIGLIANVSMIIILKDFKHMLNIKSVTLHIFSDTLSSVGVILGGLMIYLTNLTIIDPLVAIGISAMILRSASMLLKDAIYILLEGVPRGIDLNKITNVLKSIKGVIDVHDLHVWCITTDLIALSAHVITNDQMLSQGSKIISEIKSKMLEFGIKHITIQLESEDKIKDIDMLDNKRE